MNILGDIAENWLSFTELKMYSGQLQMVYCKLDVLMKMVNCNLMKIVDKKA